LKESSNRRRFIQQASAALALPAFVRDGQTSKSSGLSPEFIAHVPQMMEWANVPGLSAAVVRDGKIVWTRGFGIKKAGEKDLVDENTLIACGSLSKPVFAYGIHKLREENLLELDRPLVSYLNASDLPDDPRTQQITARHCLTHSTGWQNWRFRPGDQLQFAFNPGERFSYSGEGMYLLQRVAEQITGRGFEAFMRERVLDPLGMTRSTYIRLPEQDAYVASGHNVRGLPQEFGSPQQRQKMMELAKEWNKPVANWRYEDVMRAQAKLAPDLPPLPNFVSPNCAGSLLTTPTEYARFIIRLMEQKPLDRASLSESTRREMMTPQIKINSAISWGLGIGLEIGSKKTSFWHWGDNGTYKAFVYGEPVNRSGVVVLTNSSNGHKLWQRIVAAATGSDHAAFLFWMT
jgi:CubicO group peptidase (beta-lactamase class C family)